MMLDGTDEAKDLELYPGNFYRPRDGGLWCCYRVDATAPIASRAACVEIASDQLLSFYPDGRHDVADYSLVKELSEYQAMTCLAVKR